MASANSSRCATDAVAVSRADLQISRAGDGELLLHSRQDGMIRMLVPDTAGTAAAAR